MNENVYNFNFELVQRLCVQTESAKTNLNILHGKWREKREKTLVSRLRNTAQTDRNRVRIWAQKKDYFSAVEEWFIFLPFSVNVSTQSQ